MHACERACVCQHVGVYVLYTCESSLYELCIGSGVRYKQAPHWSYESH